MPEASNNNTINRGQATIILITGEAHRISSDWWNTSDNLLLEQFYSPIEQRHNDRILHHFSHHIHHLLGGNGYTWERFRHLLTERKNTAAGKVSEWVALGATWYCLRTWSGVFLGKKGQKKQKLSDSKRWLDCLLQVDRASQNFSHWLQKTYIDCTMAEHLKALRLLAVAFFLGTQNSVGDYAYSESLFSLALLYPLVDDFMDTESSILQRQAFAQWINGLIDDDQAATTAPVSSERHRLIKELIKKAMGPLRSNNPEISLSLVKNLLTVEQVNNPSDVLFWAAGKGGFTVCLLNVLQTGQLPAADIPHLVRLGFALQILDDLQDLEEDASGQGDTIATQTRLISRDLRRQFARSINFVRHHVFLGTNSRRRALDFEEGVQAVLVETMVMLILEAALHCRSLLEEDRIYLLQHCPVSASFLRDHPIEPKLLHLVKHIINQRDKDHH